MYLEKTLYIKKGQGISPIYLQIDIIGLHKLAAINCHNIPVINFSISYCFNIIIVIIIVIIVISIALYRVALLETINLLHIFDIAIGSNIRGDNISILTIIIILVVNIKIVNFNILGTLMTSRMHFWNASIASLCQQHRYIRNIDDMERMYRWDRHIGNIDDVKGYIETTSWKSITTLHRRHLRH